ncbi:MAG: DUF5682 family protein [Planctomycetaceae bacterium]
MTQTGDTSINDDGTAEAALARVAARLPLDADALAAQTDAALADDPYWFPVRHHSPAAARHLAAVIRERKPRIVFIEGPAEANDLVEFVVDGETRPPVAIYSSWRRETASDHQEPSDDEAVESPPLKSACWYPLLEFSPEYVAMRAAAKVGAEVVFIDLPHYALLQPASFAIQPQSDDHGRRRTAVPVEARDERLIAESGFYQTLAEVAGFRSWDEGWDALFEFGALDDAEAFRRELALFCAAARATTSPERIACDGTLERERFMWRTIRETLRAKSVSAEKALVVSGGFHLFLDRDDPTPPPEIPPGEVYTSVVPYSFFRVSQLAGYGAGHRAPHFLQMHWESLAGERDDLLAEYVIRVLEKARRRGEAVSSADAISVTQHARMLAALRGRHRPVLDDLHDALLTCCCKGDPRDVGTRLIEACDDVDIGTKVGRVTARLSRLPIVDDFHARVDALGLAPASAREKRTQLTLDKRDELDAHRSAFLHRMAFLEIPFAAPADGRAADLSGGRIFRERWLLRWDPQLEPALVEKNLYGDSIESAALAVLREKLNDDERHAGRTCRHLLEAIDMDLPDVVGEVEAECGRAIDGDSRFVSLGDALRSLLVLDRYAMHRELRRDVLEELLVRCFHRACFALPDAIAVPEDQQGDVVANLLGLADVALRDALPGLDREVLKQSVWSAANATEAPFLRGAFLGMLVELRELPAEQLAAEIAQLARAPQERMIAAGDLLDGVFCVSRASILLGAQSLVAALDELLRAAEWESFLVMLPRLRGAFERLHAGQRDSVAATVARRYGLKDAKSIVELRTSVGAAARIATIDRRVAELMRGWDALRTS